MFEGVTRRCEAATYFFTRRARAHDDMSAARPRRLSNTECPRQLEPPLPIGAAARPPEFYCLRPFTRFLQPYALSPDFTFTYMTPLTTDAARAIRRRRDRRESPAYLFTTRHLLSDTELECRLLHMSQRALSPAAALSTRDDIRCHAYAAYAPSDAIMARHHDVCAVIRYDATTLCC